MSASNAVLSLPVEWDHDIPMMDEELSATSSEESSKLFEQWQSEDQDPDLEIMEIDEKLGSLLGDEIFVESCPSPTTPLEELHYMNLEGAAADVDRFTASLPNEALLFDGAKSTSLPFQARYQETMTKLAESMERSKKTRQSLVMKTEQTEHYARSPHVSGVVKSIETSSFQLRAYLKQARAA